MRHTWECDLRWADMDLLGHVNNVRYLEYAQAAREALGGGRPLGRAAVLAHRVEFVAPLVFRRRPVLVDTWVTDLQADRVTLEHEVYDEADSPEKSRSVYLRVSTELAHTCDEQDRALLEPLRGPAYGWRAMSREVRPGRDVLALRLRRSDLDQGGHASDIKVFEFLQESRVRYFMDLHTRGQEWSHHVVAQTDVDYREAIPFRASSYDVHSWIAHLGEKSFTVRSEIRDGDRVLVEAGVVMVTFDKETQRPAPMRESQRSRLAQELAG